VAAFCFSLIAFYGVSQIKPVLLERTVLFTVAFPAALIGAGVAASGRARLATAILGAALVPQMLGVANQYGQRSHYGEDWRALGAHLAQAAGPLDAVVAVGSFEAIAVRFYMGAPAATRPIFTVLGASDRLAVHVVQNLPAMHILRDTADATELCTNLGDSARVWVASRDPVSYPDFVRAVTRLLQDAGAALGEERRFGALPLQRWSAPTCGTG
jgi:hypothetical protein